jgi:hypothetical protein
MFLNLFISFIKSLTLIFLLIFITSLYLNV